MRIKIRRSWFKWLIKFVLSGLVLLIGFCGSVYFGFWGKLPSKDDILNIKQAEASIILDANQELVGKYFIFDRQIVAFDQLPKHLIDALIATEDARFYEHKGIDYESLLRVVFKTILLQNNSSGGGSTISQQLVKNLYGREEHGWFSMPVNKTKEMILAQRFETLYTKQDIITMYLNTVPFSENVFGIESASQRFFSKPAKALSLSEAATLVGTLKATHSFNPRLFPERSQFRRDVVLQQMEKYNYISSSVRAEASNQSLEINYKKYSHTEGTGAYFRARIRSDVKKLLDSLSKTKGTNFNLFKDGLKIYTTLDLNMQRYAEHAMQKHMKALQLQFEKSYGKQAPWIANRTLIDHRIKALPIYKRLKKAKWNDKAILDSLMRKSQKRLFSWEGDMVKNASVIDSLQHMMKFLNSGFVAVNPKNGAVKAYVGGIDYEWFKYDHVSDAKRQVGSTFKPIVYTTALERGINACTYYPVKEITYTNQKDWTPKNGGKAEVDRHLNYAFEKALSESVNTIAVKVLEDVGIDAVIEQAERMGITSDLPEVPSLALGTAELSMLELIKSYTTFANEGQVSEPFFITKIEDKFGTTIYEHPESYIGTEAFSEATRQTMIELMKSTINSGTAKRMRSIYGLQNDLAGKTGTTQNNKDGWFLGLSPNLVMLSWVGNDDHRIGFKNTTIGQGANSALPIVALFLKQLNSDTSFNNITKATFERPSDDVLASLDCELEKRDGFLKRLFTKDKKERAFDSESKEKKGIFSFLKKKKDNK